MGTPIERQTVRRAKIISKPAESNASIAIDQWDNISIERFEDINNWKQGADREASWVLEHDDRRTR